jgi:rhodanese-related sulfurtransferase
MAGGPRVTLHRLLAGIALALGVLAAVAGTPEHSENAVDVRKLAAEITREEDHVTALELARWIRDRKPGLRVVDLRTEAEFDEYHVPGSQRMTLEELITNPPASSSTLVLVSDGGAHAAQAWTLLRASGRSHVYFLRGGLGEWVGEVMNPAGATPEVAQLSRYFGGVPRAAGTSRPADPIAETRRRGC